jgi:hypothetical protein
LPVIHEQKNALIKGPKENVSCRVLSNLCLLYHKFI